MQEPVADGWEHVPSAQGRLVAAAGRS